MGTTLRLGQIRGIPIQIHWTFSLLIVWAALSGYLSDGNWASAVATVGFVLLLFVCVLLHELGHALAALRYGISTRDITLLPIGGVARMERIPRRPRQELVVALAGPAVNVVIAAAIAGGLWITPGGASLSLEALINGGILPRLFLINVGLVVFNMLPAFPMDGGRVFRALLALKMEYSRATQIAAWVGQLFALGFVFLGFYNPFLFFIAAFVYFGASAEASQAMMQEKYGKYLVRDGMIKRFKAIAANASIQDIAERLLDRSQLEYPVVRNGIFVGMLRREDLLRGLQLRENAIESDAMATQTAAASADDLLLDVFQSAGGKSVNVLPITESGQVVGLLDLTQAFELVKARTHLQSALANTPTASVSCNSDDLANSWHD